MTEPDVTLTDYAIAILCAALAILAARWPAPGPPARRHRAWWTALFASIGAGALTGGTVHGFFLDESTAGYQVLWPATLLILGVTSVAMWFLGSLNGPRPRVASVVRAAALAALAVYSAVVLFVDDRFVVAIAMYLPATVFLLAMLTARYARRPAPRVAVAIAGLLLTFVAAAVQQLHVAIHPVYFNHNALYHVIQGVALVMLHAGGRWLVTASSAEPAG